MFNNMYESIKKDDYYFYFYDNGDLFLTAYAYSMYKYVDGEYISIFESYMLLCKYKTLYINISDYNNYSLLIRQPYLINYKYNTIISFIISFIIFTLLSIPFIKILSIKCLLFYLPILIILEIKYFILIDYFEYHSFYKLYKNILKIEKKHIIFIIISLIINSFRPFLLISYFINKILFNYEIEIIIFLFPEIKIRKSFKLIIINILKAPLN